MPVPLDDADREYLGRAIEISRRSLTDNGKTPFGALVVIDGQLAGEGTSSVMELRDPTAHAEVMALRAAGQAMGTHLFETGVMYCSSEPCPMCLAACYWARLPRLVFAATSHDVGRWGFEDLQFYRQLALPGDQRALQPETGDADLRAQAVLVLRAWAEKLPFPVTPKY